MNKIKLILFCTILNTVLVSAQDKIQKNSESEFIQETKRLVDKLCENNHFSGAILLAKGEDILYEDACGEASKRFHVANKINTKFNLGSMNKMFTAVAIMQLVDKGIVKLSDRISKYIDKSWLPNEITNKVTIHHLLSHSSGLGTYFNQKYIESSRELYRTIEEFKPLVKNEKLAFEPGERFQYSNTGMLLLGVVIEKATNQDYFEYIRQKIYKPTSMNNSDAYDMDQPVENLAIGYVPTTNNKYGWENNIYKHVIKGGPAGGGFSTVRDLHKFAIALTQGKLVSMSSLKLLWTDYYNSNYGYGFGVRILNNEKIVGHNGGFPGLNSELDIFLDQGYIIVVMSNHDRGAQPIARRVRELISNNRLK